MEMCKEDLVKRFTDVVNWQIQAEEWKKKKIKNDDFANKILGYVYLRSQDYQWETEQKCETGERDSITVTQEIFKHKKVSNSQTTDDIEKPIVFESSLNNFIGQNIQDPFQFFDYPISEELINLLSKDDKSICFIKEIYKLKKKLHCSTTVHHYKNSEDKFLQIHETLQKYRRYQTTINRATQTEKNREKQNTCHFNSSERGDHLKVPLQCKQQNMSAECDLAIAVGKRLFKCHRVLLMACSGWFHRKLISLPKVTKRIILNGIDPDAFGVIHNWIYTNNLEVDVDNIASLLNVANKLEMPTLIKKLKSTFEYIVISEGPISILKKAQSLHNDLLSSSLIDFLPNCIPCLPQSEAFLHYNTDLICLLFSSKYCHKAKSSLVFAALISWLTHNWDLRQHELNRILDLIDFTDFSNDEVIECFDNIKMLAKTEGQKKSILAAFTKRLDDEMRKNSGRPRNTNHSNLKLTNELKSNRSYSPRSASGGSSPQIYSKIDNLSQNRSINDNEETKSKERSQLRSYFLIAGGIDPFSKTKNENYGNCLFCYDINENYWGLLDYMPGARHHGAATRLHRCMYYTGGSNVYDGNHFEATNSVWCFDYFDGHWLIKQSMIYTRVCHSLVSIDGLLYAVGGMDKSNHLLNSIECYDPTTDMWTEVAFLEHPRMGMAVTIYHNMILICGGIGEDSTSSFSLVLKTCELYVPKTRKVMKVKPLRIPRCFASLIVMNKKLFLIGGATLKESKKNSQTVSIKDIDVWEENSKAWVANNVQLPAERQDLVCGFAGNRLFVMGGQSSQNKEIISKVECYDYMENQWIDSITSMPVELSGITSVVLDTIPYLTLSNIKPFTA